MKLNNRYKSISIFFPAYNEETNIKYTVLGAKKVTEKLFSDFEIIIINDGSTDRTGKIADKLAQKHQEVKVVHHKPNRGYGGALISGFKQAKKELVFFSDADLQFDLKEIKNLLFYIDRYDIVIGYRNPRKDPPLRILNAFGWKLLNRILFDLKIKDIDCAFKLFRQKVIRSIKIESKGAMVSAELLIKLRDKGYKFKEVPVKHLPRISGKPTGAKLKVIIKAFKELWSFYQVYQK